MGCWSCYDNCQEYNFRSIDILPTNLEAHLQSLQQDGLWILSNDQNDTLIIKALNTYSLSESISTDAGSRYCDVVYQGLREYEAYQLVNGEAVNPKSFELSVAYGTETTRYTIWLPSFYFDWTFAEDESISNNYAFQDSMLISGNTFYNVYYDQKSFQDSTAFLFNGNKGFVAVIGYFDQTTYTIKNVF